MNKPEKTTTTETIKIPVHPPNKIALPEFLSTALIKIEIDVQKLREVQLRLLAMYLKAEGLDGEWALSPDLTAAVRHPAKEQAS